MFYLEHYIILVGCTKFGLRVQEDKLFSETIIIIQHMR